jgi:exosortase
LALLGGAALLLAYLPLLALHFRLLWLRPHLQFVPFVVLGAGVLALVRLRAPGTVLAAPGRSTYVLAAAAWVLLAGAELLYSPWLGAVAALAALAAAVLGVGGRPLLGRLWPALALLCLAVPPPSGLDRDLILSLQRLTTAWSSRVLDYLGVLHLRAGNVIEVGGRRMLVEEACSGINSLLPIVACTLFFVFLVRRPPLRAALLLAAAVGWVLAANMVRVVIVISLSASGGLNLTGGWRHEAVGLALFAVVLALVASTDRLLQFLAETREAAPPSAAPPGPAPLIPARHPWFASWPVAVAFLLPAAFHVWAYGGGGPRVGRAATAALASLSAETLPARCAAWERQGFATETRDPGSPYGQFSSLWTYGHGASTATVSLDHPFAEWHDLSRCYTAQGWVIDEETLHESSGAVNLPGGYMEVKLSQPGSRCGHLLFCQFDGDGRPLPPRRLGWARLAAGRHEGSLRRLWQLARGTPEPPLAEPVGPVYQLQLFCEGFAPPTPAEQQQTQALFLQSWMALRQHWPD